jgi:predicted DNA-binding protein (MmcQ/YjbR family)
MLSNDELRKICLAQKSAVETYPFGEQVAVFKVMGKMFALVAFDEESYISLKIDPEESLLLQASYPQITPGYHLNKKHWVTVKGDEHLPDDLVVGLIEDAYALVVKSLTKAQRAELAKDD